MQIKVQARSEPFNSSPSKHTTLLNIHYYFITDITSYTTELNKDRTAMS